MGNLISKVIRISLTGVSAAILALALAGTVASAGSNSGATNVIIGGIIAQGVVKSSRASAQSSTQSGTIKGEKYLPGIWVDPDGCEHWVMDDGVEGYMSPHVTRQGIPVCRRGNVCGVLNTDQLFATDKYAISKAGRARLQQFFQSASARAYTIVGHTDSRASDKYNMRLSLNRANAVARVAQSVGAKVVDVRGYGERVPVASNGSAAGMRKNRRVEIICIR